MDNRVLRRVTGLAMSDSVQTLRGVAVLSSRAGRLGRVLLYRAFPWAGSMQSVLPMRAVADLGITYTYYLDSTPKSSKVAVLHL